MPYVPCGCQAAGASIIGGSAPSWITERYYNYGAAGCGPTVGAKRVENGVNVIQKWVPFTPKCSQKRWRLGLRPRPLIYSEEERLWRLPIWHAKLKIYYYFIIIILHLITHPTKCDTNSKVHALSEKNNSEQVRLQVFRKSRWTNRQVPQFDRQLIPTENGVNAIQKWVPFTSKCSQKRWRLRSAPDPRYLGRAPPVLFSLTRRVENGVNAIWKWVTFTPKCSQKRWRLGRMTTGAPLQTPDSEGERLRRLPVWYAEREGAPLPIFAPGAINPWYATVYDYHQSSVDWSLMHKYKRLECRLMLIFKMSPYLS